MKQLCTAVKNILIEESNVQYVFAPVTIVGDLHGQLWDLKELFMVGGSPPNTNYLFLGDYVDRGHYSVEVITLLTCLKLQYPERVTLLRGNHESRQTTTVYGFYAECVRKYGNPAVWSYFVEMFDYLNIAAVISGKFLCVHGGLSPNFQTLDQLRVLDRFQEIPHDGPLADLMWSDPDPEQSGFAVSVRGVGYTFGEDVLQRFLELNGVDSLIRAHQLCMDGYQTLFKNQLATVWSAPNYCGRMGNVAAILEIDDQLNWHFNSFLAAPESESQKESSSLPNYFM